MTIETITTYRAGAFTTETAPAWFMEIHRRADSDNSSWDDALKAALGDMATSTVAETHLLCPTEALDWITPDGGRYVEFRDTLRLVGEVWVPDPADWLPFYKAHILPFVQTHAIVSMTGLLDRIGNCLIAYGRHGEGRHIDTSNGHSDIDIEPWRATAKRLA